MFYTEYILDMANNSHRKNGTIMIEVRVDELLEAHGRSFYWLAKETGISHTTLWRLKKGKALGINFETLEKICLGLDCQPGDVLRLAKEKKTNGKQVTRRKAEKT
jgi:putative transcriptional regulator